MEHHILNKYFVVLTVMCAVLVMSNNASAAFQPSVDKQSIIKELINAPAPQCLEFDYLLDRYCNAGRADGQNGRVKVIKGEDIKRKYIKITSDLSIIFEKDQGYLYDSNNPLLLKGDDLFISRQRVMLFSIFPILIPLIAFFCTGFFHLIFEPNCIHNTDDAQRISPIKKIWNSPWITGSFFFILTFTLVYCICSPFTQAEEINDKLVKTSLCSISAGELDMVRKARVKIQSYSGQTNNNKEILITNDDKQGE